MRNREEHKAESGYGAECTLTKKELRARGHYAITSLKRSKGREGQVVKGTEYT